MKALKILFADDDLKYSMLLKRFLEKEGYEVTYAGNGKIALEQFPLIKPDLVLLDINMPGYNGFEVAERIRETDKHVLIFLLSDRSDKADRLQGFQLKANDYLVLLPTLDYVVEESGKTAVKAEGVSSVTFMNGKAVLELQSGTYQFVVKKENK